MFGGIMSYLKKAKTTLEKDESTLKLQQENYARIDQRQEEESKEIKEKQRTEIEDKRAKELAKKKEIELELIRVDQEVLLKKIDLMYTQMGEYILTKTQPPLFWKPNKSHEDITKLLESSNKRVDDMKQKHIDQTTEILAKVKEEYLDFINKKLDDVEIKPETVDNKQEIASDTESSQEIKKNSEDEDSKAEAN